MISQEEYWNQIRPQTDLVEHLAQVYCGKTRCLLTEDDEKHIYESIITALANTQLRILEDEEKQRAQILLDKEAQKKKDLEALRDKRRQAIVDFAANKSNSYNHGDQERAYWTYCDCMTIISHAESIAEIEAAYRIFKRYKYFL